MPVLLVREPMLARLEVCSGTQEATESDFRPGSLVPREDWRKVTLDERPAAWDLYSSGKCLLDNIALIKIFDVDPPHEKQKPRPTTIETYPARRSSLHNLDEPRPTFALDGTPKQLESPDTRQMIQQEFIEVSKLLAEDASLEYKGGWLSKGGGRSLCTTIDHSVGLRVGLHVDRWEQRPLHTLSEARNRICLNLGPNPRYFIFVSTDLREIAAKYNFDFGKTFTTRHAKAYLRDDQNVPVHRLRIDPGEAYIAPTESLIHDGQESNTNGAWVCNLFGRLDNSERAMRLSVM